MTRLIELRDRVLAATGPDRELDARLDAFFAGRTVENDTYLPTGSPCLVARNPKPPHDAYVIWIANDPGYGHGRALTASLDAVVALCERVRPSTPTRGPLASRSPWVGFLRDGIATMGHEAARRRVDYGIADLPRFVLAALLTALAETTDAEVR